MTPLKTELRKNGSYQLLLSGGDGIDAAILEAMATATAANPANLIMRYEDGVATFEVRNA